MASAQDSRGVQRLASEHPEWVPVLEAALAVASRAEPYGGEFAGSWVLKELESRAGRRQWIPNLRLLLTFGIIEKSGETTRGGRRAYYRFLDRGAVEEAVEELKGSLVREPTPVLSFIGAGASSGEPSDTARRSSELHFEPRSWR
ncbi:MAG: hypothetical protein ACYDGR_13090 [Candidatus Dormibacteria bacterium]